MQDKKLGTGSYIFLTLVCIACAVLSSLGIELLFLSTISTVIFAVLLCTEKLYKVLYIPVLSGVISFVITRSKIRSFIAILFIVSAIVLTLMIFKNVGNSSVVIGLTVSYLILSALAVTGMVRIAYGDIKGGYLDIVNQSRDSINYLLDTVFVENGAPDMYIEFLREYVHALKMAFPGLLIFIMEIFALLSSMLLKLISKINDTGVYKENPWYFELSVPGSIVLILSMLVSIVFSFENVVYYVCENLTLILLMFGAFVGIRAIFGRRSAFRRTNRGGYKAFSIIFCAVLFVLSPIFLLVYLSLRGALYSIGDALLRARLKAIESDDDEDNNNDDNDGV